MRRAEKPVSAGAAEAVRLCPFQALHQAPSTATLRRRELARGAPPSDAAHAARPLETARSVERTALDHADGQGPAEPQLRSGGVHPTRNGEIG